MASPIRTAVVLAAGMGTRLHGVWSELPKGFVEIGGESLIERSLRLLREQGVERVVIVAGHLAQAYHDLAARSKGVEVVENKAYAETGSMASMAVALETVFEDFILIESDLFYEDRALDSLLTADAPDVLLASGPTGATDEVWVEAPGGRLRRLSKERETLGEVSGELVGLLRVSSELAARMRRAYLGFVSRHGHGQMAYETDALVEVAESHPVYVCLIPDLLWGEVDYPMHYERVRDQVWPQWLAKRTTE